MALIEMSQLLNPPLCANIKRNPDGEALTCIRTASSACRSCMLVQYCSKNCQTAHWPEHKKVCKSETMKSKYVPAWVKEHRTPAFVGGGAPFVSFGKVEFLWGNMPAIDILNWKDNEGTKDLGRDVNLLFAATGDPRNVMKTIVGLPNGYRGRCKAVLNDRSLTVVARNIILLLMGLHFEPEVAASMMVHLWYSALLPDAMVTTLQEEIWPYVQDMCDKIQDKPDSSLQAKTFGFEKTSIRVVLSKEQWFSLKGFFYVPAGIDAELAQKKRKAVMCAPERLDYRDRSMYAQTPAHRTGAQKFRSDGILLPFGCSTESFNTPNPRVIPVNSLGLELTLTRTFFEDSRGWPMKDSANPIEGWAQEDYMSGASAAKGDMYGAYFHFVRKFLQGFCEKVRAASISFQLYNLDARELPKHISVNQEKKILFDRIELANICDRGYVGPEATLQTFVPLLKPRNDSPKATLLFLFMNAVGESAKFSSFNPGAHALKMQELQKILGPDPTIMNAVARGDTGIQHDPEFLYRSNCLDMLGDYNKLWIDFTQEVGLGSLAKRNGVGIKKKHTIIGAWPFRIPAKVTKKVFKELAASPQIGWERYVEFERLT